MNTQANLGQELALALADAWGHLERQLSSSLGALRGVSFAEYRLLLALSQSPKRAASRIELARRIGLTASGVTRALRPLEKLGMVETVKSERDARLALATLTAAGQSVVTDASSMVDDTMAAILERYPKLSSKAQSIAESLSVLRGQAGVQ